MIKPLCEVNLDTEKQAITRLRKAFWSTQSECIYVYCPLAEIGGRTGTVGRVLDCKGGRGLDSQDRTESERLKTN